MNTSQHLILISLVTAALAAGGCATIDRSSLSCAWRQRDYAEINGRLKLRCAAATPLHEEEFHIIQDILLEADSGEMNQHVALQRLAHLAFAYCDGQSHADLRELRLREYETLIRELLSNADGPKCSTTLLWLYANQHYATKGIVDAVLCVVAETQDPEKRKRAITFLSGFCGFVHAGFFFTDDALPGVTEAFPLGLVDRYWRENYDKVMQHRENLWQYARMGFYRDTGMVFAQPLPLPTYTPPQDMGLLPEDFPFE